MSKPLEEARDAGIYVEVPRALLRRIVGSLSFSQSYLETTTAGLVDDVTMKQVTERSAAMSDQNDALCKLASIGDLEDLDD